jgi:hypothetical protein
MSNVRHAIETSVLPGFLWWLGLFASLSLPDVSVPLPRVLQLQMCRCSALEMDADMPSRACSSYNWHWVCLSASDTMRP